MTAAKSPLPQAVSKYSFMNASVDSLRVSAHRAVEPVDDQRLDSVRISGSEERR